MTEPVLPPGHLVGGLIRACHPEPTVAVTLFATVLALRAGLGSRSLLVAAAVLGGQLCIGWSNDRLDAGRDLLSGRLDKPVATGTLPSRVVDMAIVVALLATFLMSFLLGWRAGLANLWVLGWGLLYNLGLKSTWLSWVPYALAFGALPAVATYARSHAQAPAGWVVLAGALLGVAANLVNALPDLVDDAATGVRGLPHRLGARRSLLLASLLLVLVTVCVVFGPSGGPDRVGWLGAALVLAVVAAGLRWALAHPAAKATFLGILAIAASNLVLLVVTTDGLT